MGVGGDRTWGAHVVGCEVLNTGEEWGCWLMGLCWIWGNLFGLPGQVVRCDDFYNADDDTDNDTAADDDDDVEGDEVPLQLLAALLASFHPS